ncbi:MAG: hypothetical protein HZB46_04975 [Solirubrobacterales bacterium]|nr:hypothetical protein [Solirubrobacterales bacterium]
MAGVIAALAFFVARDDATTSVPPPAGPGVAARDPAALAADLRRGNVVLLAARSQQEAAKAIGEQVAGAATPELRAAGQAVLVPSPAAVRASGVPLGGPEGCRVIALAAGRRMCARTAADPGLQRFTEFWLGRGADG